jgi:hypothetical protein
VERLLLTALATVASLSLGACEPAVTPTAAPGTPPVSQAASTAPATTVQPPRTALPTIEPAQPVAADARIAARITLPNPDALPGDPFFQTPFADQIAVTDGAIWIMLSTGSTPTVVRVGTADNEATTSSPFDFVVSFAADGADLWATGPYGYAPGPEFASVYRIDVATGKPRELRPVRHGGGDFLAAMGSLWVEGDGGVWRLDPSTGERLAVYDLRGHDYFTACDSLWSLGDEDDGGRSALFRIDPETGAVRETYALERPAIPVGARDRCWLASSNAVWSLKPGGLLPAPSVTERPVVVAGQTLWTLSRGVIRRIDAWTGEVIEPGWPIDPSLIEVQGKGGRLQFLDAGGSLWLLNRDQLIRFDIPTS